MITYRRSVFVTVCLLIFVFGNDARLRVNAFVPSGQNIVQTPSKKSYSLERKVPLETVGLQKKSGQNWSLANSPTGGAQYIKLDVTRIAVTISGTFLTWLIQRQYTNVLASSALTLAYCMVLNKRFNQAVFCGTFAGMASKSIIPSWQYALGLGVFTSTFYETLIEKKNAFVGVGGRLGATAFLASLAIALIQGTPTGLSMASLSLGNLNKCTILSMALWHAIGSVSTILLRQTDAEAKDPVKASAVVGLIGALLLEDKTAALAVYGGSFVGMSAPNRLLHGLLPSQGVGPVTSKLDLLLSFAIAGALGGAVHGASIGLNWFNGGWGGKAGLCGFLGCLIFRALRPAARATAVSSQ